MRISMITYGTRGDLDPFISIALELTKKGHEVTIVGPKNFVVTSLQYGLKAVVLNIDTHEYYTQDEWATIRIHGETALTSKNMPSPYNAMHDVAFEACADAEGIITSVHCLAAGQYISEKLKIPLINANLYPITEAVDATDLWDRQKEECNAKRRELGLKELNCTHIEHMKHMRTPNLHLYSSVLFPRPLEWPMSYIMSGFVFLDDNKELPQDCKNFFEQGPPPISLTFGSMAIPNFSGLLSIIKAVSETTNQRFIVGRGWSKDVPGFYDKNIFVYSSSINHNLIFPKCSAVIHHGGAGTTAAGLRAGKPTGIFSFFLDQFLWGERIKKLGIGDTYRYLALNELLLREMIIVLQEEEVKRNADEIGRAIRNESGLSRTIDFIEDYFGIRSNRKY